MGFAHPANTTPIVTFYPGLFTLPPGLPYLACCRVDSEKNHDVEVLGLCDPDQAIFPGGDMMSPILIAARH